MGKVFDPDTGGGSVEQVCLKRDATAFTFEDTPF